MKRPRTGYYVPVSTAGGENVRAFVPDPLPPNPQLDLNEALRDILEQALLALGRLDSVSTLLPDTSLFLYMYIRKEAVLSSQIEGTQSSLSDLLLFEIKEAPGVPIDDVQEVSNYVTAVNHGLRRLKNNFPVSLRLVRELHSLLLTKARGGEKAPGEFRRSQNWIGGTRPGNAQFVPPPADKVPECMGALEKFIHDQSVRTSVLIKAACMHAQFETIHPFLDGNGRVGRLLIPLLLCAEEVLSEPLLFLSLYFKNHRQEYYACLQNVRLEGDWENWLLFFLTGVKETAEQAVRTAKSLLILFEKDHQQVQTLGKSAGSALRVHHILHKHPIVTIPKAQKLAGLSYPATKSALTALQKVGITNEITGKKRNQIYTYKKYVKILSEGMEADE